ncbi:AraC family transcriptional regulator [Deinococcus frigens]|uniref:AraC family transcriptional regulator n=1 Tax=Deinococcus frigens TaxID=249403 RepID=UPI00138E4D96|nr:AraC family transcriptional regulator [Deinococcus frigens]
MEAVKTPARSRLARDEARLWRIPFLGGLDILQARFIRQAFARHTHEVFTVGVVHQGAAAFWNRGAEHVAQGGSVMLINPDEVNTGHSFAESGYVHLVVYPSAEQLQMVAGQITGKSVSRLYFAQSVATAPEVARRLTAAHRLLVTPEATQLAQEMALQDALVCLVSSLGEKNYKPQPMGREPSIAGWVREYLEEHACENVSLDDLARLTQRSSFHLTRVFGREFGLPPHAYQVQVRIRRAQGWLRAGQGLTQVALAAGFNDQSAFSNQFKRHVGVTPGQYARSSDPKIS